MIAATGPESENFTHFYNAFASGNTKMIFGKVTAIAGVNQKLKFVIETADNAKSSSEASKERIVALAATGPVLVFGLSISAELKVKLSKDIYMANLTTDDQVRSAIKSAAGKSRGGFSMI